MHINEEVRSGDAGRVGWRSRRQRRVGAGAWVGPPRSGAPALNSHRLTRRPRRHPPAAAGPPGLTGSAGPDVRTPLSRLIVDPHTLSEQDRLTTRANRRRRWRAVRELTAFCDAEEWPSATRNGCRASTSARSSRRTAGGASNRDHRARVGARRRPALLTRALSKRPILLQHLTSARVGGHETKTE